MDKVTEIYRTSNLVKDILEDDEKARNSDLYLYIKICERVNPAALKLPFAVVMADLKSFNLPCTETVRRARQKIQEKHPELAGCRKVNKLRSENEAIFREYSRKG